ncbi:hypothetical protein [Propionispira raffinosivorans]|uniref:hypothetical protein n=1 Tax=Propionispira raffinosivorans TaxID=86959 RepID=UPI00035F80E4|nr:hypothetical protein [Propionispira raffinosivorans]
MVKNMWDKFFILFMALSLFCITRQVPFQQLGGLITPLYIISLIFYIRNIRENIYSEEKYMQRCILIYVMFFSIMFFYAIALGNEFYYVLQTYAVILLLIFAYYIKPNEKIISVYIFLALLHAIVLIGLNYFFITTMVHENFIIRAIFSENGYGGDAFFVNDYLCRIIIKGNELLPLAIMLVEVHYEKMKKYLLLCIFIFATIIAGNFGFIMALFIFYILWWIYQKKYKTICCVFVGLLVSGSILSTDLSEYISGKQDSSWSARIDQVNVLVDDFDTAFDIVVGKGMGNNVNVRGQYRDYSGQRYYEVQGMYIFNQIGFMGMILVIFMNIILSVNYFKSMQAKIIYIAYFSYAITNPYIFNIFHLIVINVLVSIPITIDKRIEQEG